MVPATALATVRWVLGRRSPPTSLRPAIRPARRGSRGPSSRRSSSWARSRRWRSCCARGGRASGSGGRRGARSATRSSASAAFAIGGLVVVSILRGGIPGPAAGGSAVSYVLLVLLGAAAIALAEELAFRGVVQHWLARTTGEWPAVVVQGVAYGLWVAAVGWGPLVGVLAVGAGLVAGVITMRTNSILTCSRGTPGSPSRCSPSWSARDRRGRGPAGGAPGVGAPRSTSTRRASGRSSAGSSRTCRWTASRNSRRAGTTRCG